MTLLKSSTKIVPVKAHRSIGLVEQYYTILYQAYKVIIEDLQGTISKEKSLEIAIKVVNDTIGHHGLVPNFFIFKAYPYI